MPSFWDDRYSATEYAYGTQPNTFFKECLDQLSPGHLLLPAEGEGRNAVFAAQSGWQVDAFDYSAVAREKALALARMHHVELTYTVADIASFPWQEAQFDAIGLCFVHLPAPQRQFMHQHVVRALKPGGHLILEAFHPEQLAFTSGGPRSLDLLYTLEQLYTDFDGLEFRAAYNTETVLSEGPYHAGNAAVVRIFAKKT